MTIVRIYSILEVIMRAIPAGEFKAHCLALLKEVYQKQSIIVVTKYGPAIDLERQSYCSMGADTGHLVMDARTNPVNNGQ